MTDSSSLRTQTSAERLIAAFPATGKSFYAQSHEGVADSDSSLYSWKWTGPETRERHPDWPANYLEHIRQLLGEGKTVLVSTHAEVREALTAEDLPFTLVYPGPDHRVEYLARMARRGSPLGLIELVDKNWSAWISELFEQPCAIRCVLGKGGYLSDAIA